MEQAEQTSRDLSARRVFGFASNQAFAFFLLYMQAVCAVDLSGWTFGRVELFCVLAFVVVGFLLLGLLPSARRNALFARPLLYVYAVIMVGGSLLSMVVPDGGPAVLLGQGLLTGIPFAFVLTAWGKTFGSVPTEASTVEVFVGSLVAALVCLIFALAADTVVFSVAIRLLPLASVVNIQVPTEEDMPKRAASDAEDAQVGALSLKIIAGTVAFGAAAGLFEATGAASAAAGLAIHPMTMVLFGAFLIGSVSLLLSDGFGRGAALNKSYRLAVFIMMMGVLLAPWPALAQTIMPGEAVVMAGYLGLETVLVSLFLVLAEIAALDPALAFSRGFLALFAGELLGVLLANCLSGALVQDTLPYVVIALAGGLVLVSYVFLFTERDFDALSQIVEVTDRFEDTCEAIAERFGLSSREAEILAFALRGRSSERIAQELVISKSTVDTHLRRIYAKAGVHSRQELLDLAESYKG